MLKLFRQHGLPRAISHALKRDKSSMTGWLFSSRRKGRLAIDVSFFFDSVYSLSLHAFSLSSTWKVMFFKCRGDRNSPILNSTDLATLFLKVNLPLLAFLSFSLYRYFYFYKAITRFLIIYCFLFLTSLLRWLTSTTHPLMICSVNSLLIFLCVSGSKPTIFWFFCIFYFLSLCSVFLCTAAINRL